MLARIEERRLLLLVFLTDMVCYAFGLRFASFTVLQNLPYTDPFLLQRDRLACMVLFGICALLLGCYDTRRISDRFDTIYYILLALGLAILHQLALSTLLPEGLRVISRRELVASIPVTALLLILWRGWAAGFVLRFGSLHRRFYVLGAEDEGRRIAAAISDDQGIHAEATYFSLDDLKTRFETEAATPLGRVPEEAIVLADDAHRGRAAELLHFCEEHFERVYLYPGLEDLLLFNQGRMQALAGIPLVEISGMRQPYPYVHIKRAMDIAAALIGLILSAPIAIVTAVLVKLTSPGPVFYTQSRVGRGGQEFKIYKFRSMRSDIQEKDAAGHVLARADDPRITPVGKFIRKHRIDEIPQLYNVLIGEMSLVGPRPVWKEFYESMRDELPLYDLRLLVQPGLTSLSHMLGSYESEPRDRLRYDLVYINSLSLLLDLKIIVQTVRIVLSGKGAQ